MFRKTKRGNSKPKDKSYIIRVFMEMLNLVKIYHWNTKSYGQHKATDELYERLNEHIDKFVEVLLGKNQTRVHLIEHRIELVDSINTFSFKQRIHEYREFLMDLDIIFDKKRDSDLLNIRDELLGDLNQFLYLMHFTR